MHEGNGTAPLDNGQGDWDANADQRRFLSELLVSNAEQIAEHATGLLRARCPDLMLRYEPMALEHWRENLRSRVGELAAAVLAGSASIFVDHLVWARVAFEARGVPADDLQRSLDALGEAVEHFVPEEDRADVGALVRDAGRALHEKANPPASALDLKTPTGSLAGQYLLAVLEGDRLRASEVVLGAVRAGTLSVLDAYERVLEPAQAELGRLWHMGDLTIAEEHFATTTTQLVMGQLYPLLPRAPRHGKVVICASVEGNWHDLGIRTLADYFEMAGWRVIFLGCSVPAEDLAVAVDHFEADVLCVSAMLPAQVRACEQTVGLVRARERGSIVKLLVGGQAFIHAPGIWRDLGADGFARRPREAVELAGRLVGVAGLVGVASPTNPGVARP